MPIQRGKKRKRTRRHSGRDDGCEEPVTAAPVESPKPRPKVWRRGHQPAPIVNLIFGLMMLILGLVFFVSGLGASGGTKFLLLLLYMLVAGFYLSRAFRQYRARRHT